MDNYMLAGILFCTLFVLVAVWFARMPYKVDTGPHCPACKAPTSWRTCSADVAPECYTAAICDACNRVGGEQ